METNSVVVPQDMTEGKFTVLLNGQRDLEEQLLVFKKACDVHDKHRRKKRKRRYYNLGLMAKIVCHTTKQEMLSLLKHGTRTFLIDTVTNKVEVVEEMTKLLAESVAELQSEDTSTKAVIGLAVEIAGDCCRLGRMHNDCSIFVIKGSMMTLTTDQSYQYSGFKEICYIINLKFYLPYLRLRDEIKLGYEVRGYIVKLLKHSITIEIFDAGLLNSYEYLELPNQCFSLQVQGLPAMFEHDLKLAAKLRADFIVMPRIRCYPFLKTLRSSIKNVSTFKLIGTIDLDYVSAKMIDIMAIVRLLDVLWLPNIFNLTSSMYKYVTQDVIPISKGFNKPIIGSVPLERCSDFHDFKNHEFLWKIDCIFIEKSKWCNKYPLIVKKLLPIKDFRIAVVENSKVLRNILTSYKSIVNFIIRTISSIECQGIFLYSKCETAAASLGRVEIYCPVYVLLPFDDINEDNAEEMCCRLRLAKVLNVRRNILPIAYTKEMNPNEHKPIDFGIEYIRQRGCIDTGDFVISIEVGKENGEDGVELGVGEDVIIMRAFYVPPAKIGTKIVC